MLPEKKERQRSCPNSKAKFPKRNDHKPKNRANFPSKKTDNSKELANDKGNATPASDLSDECNGSSHHSITSNDHDHVPPKKTVIVTTLTEKKKEVSLSSTTPAVSLSSTKRDGQNGQIDNEHSDGKEKNTHVTDKKSRMKKRETEISTEINLENKNNKQPPYLSPEKITQGVMDESKKFG
jgi:E3 ubiquitin-protein ligase DOA10